ncbi:zinc finger protein 287 [Teleopsis dalmanni]|uniref:zinc finger protein 287 n=1 Tax=Teleopsis dalmanni TaxID=139649 RepID=UPI0018CF0A51|nr:zinc finger protein 287 [Teleopsis dalmanni]
MKYDIESSCCRVCLEVNNKQRSVHIPIEEGDESPSEMLQQITGIDFDESDYDENVPKYICKSCELGLNLAFQFRLKALRAQKLIAEHCNYKQKEHRLDYSHKNTEVKQELEAVTHIYLDISSQDAEVSTSDVKKRENDHSRMSPSTEVIEYEIVPEEFYDESELKLEEIELYEEDIQIVSDDESTYMSVNEPIDIDTDKQNNERYLENKNIPKYTKLSSKEIPKTKKLRDQKQDNEVAVSKLTIDIDDEVDHGETLESKKKYSNAKQQKMNVSHICDICGNTYSKRGRLMEHRKLHNKELKYFCELCSLGFYQREMLRKHMYSHKGGKPYKCSFCSRTFFYESVKKSHEDVHRGHKPYVCSSCNKAFAYAHTLKKHELIHAEIKLYRCDYCDKDFRLQHHLKQHEETKMHQNAVLHAKTL